MKASYKEGKYNKEIYHDISLDEYVLAISEHSSNSDEVEKAIDLEKIGFD